MKIYLMLNLKNIFDDKLENIFKEEGYEIKINILEKNKLKIYLIINLENIFDNKFRKYI